jgi:hypothetical protein
MHIQIGPRLVYRRYVDGGSRVLIIMPGTPTAGTFGAGRLETRVGLSRPSGLLMPRGPARPGAWSLALHKPVPAGGNRG